MESLQRGTPRLTLPSPLPPSPAEALSPAQAGIAFSLKSAQASQPQPRPAMPPRKYKEITEPEEIAQRNTRIRSIEGRVSQRSLMRIAKLMNEDPELLNDLSTIQPFLDARADVLDRIQQILQLPMEDGTMFEWTTANLQKLIRFFIDSAPEFQEFLQAVYAKHPGTPEQPWQIILSEDELVPGALLRLDNKRKALCHYLSFMEFPMISRKHTTGWLPLGFLRSDIIKKCLGLTSGVEKHLLRNLLLGEDSVRLQGMVLPIGRDKAPVMIFANLARSINDEAAEKAFWSSRGLTIH